MNHSRSSVLGAASLSQASEMERFLLDSARPEPLNQEPGTVVFGVFACSCVVNAFELNHTAPHRGDPMLSAKDSAVKEAANPALFHRRSPQLPYAALRLMHHGLTDLAAECRLKLRHVRYNVVDPQLGNGMRIGEYQRPHRLRANLIAPTRSIRDKEALQVC